VTSPAPLVCPHCQAPLGLDAPAEPGARLTCPACGREIVVPGPSVVGESSIAGSDDDRAVTLVPSQDASTLTAGRRAAADADVATEAWQRLAGAPGAGRYVERGHIARGGMGEIVLCIDRNIRRPVAMKRILPETADDPARRARFVEEAQVTGQLEHPNIVPVHELERAPDGTLYFTMKLVKGRSLADILQALRAAEGGPTQKSSEGGAGGTASTEGFPPHSLSDLLAIFLKVCDGVAFAHSRGVVHRDLKPANIMVGDFGEVLVMDWGLAKIVGREDIRADDLVTSDRLESTPELTYALGAILYEILTLEKPVEGETPLVVLANAAHGHIVPPEKRTPSRAIPRELSAIAMKCLHKLRSRRYQSVPDLQSDIRLYLEGRSVTAAPDTFAQAAWKLVKRNQRVSASIAAAAAIIIILTAGFLIRLQGALDRARAGEAAAKRNEREATASEAKRRKTALEASEALARQAVRAADEARFAVAEVRADLAVEVMPDGPWGHYAYGVIAAGRKDYESARRHLEEALRHDGSHDLSEVLLKAVLAKTGQLKTYETLLADAQQTGDWRSLVAAGDAFYDARRYAEADRALSRAIAIVDQQETVPPSVKEQLSQKLARVRGRAAVGKLWPSVRDLPPRQLERQLEQALTGIYRSRVDVLVTEHGTISIYIYGGKLGSLDPLGGLPLSKLRCYGCRFTDLGPLRGTPLTWLTLGDAPVADLTPLRGMRLTHVEICGTKVADLSPLEGMPLKYLSCHGSPIRHLGPLAGMPLTDLRLQGTKVSDLGPLRGMPLGKLDISSTLVNDLSPLKGMSLMWLSVFATSVRDLGPLKGMPLEYLDCGATRVTDLSPLAGMPLKEVRLKQCRASDLGPLAGLPLEQLHLGGLGPRGLDLTPLANLKLKQLIAPSKDRLAPQSLKVIETLEKRGCAVLWR